MNDLLRRILIGRQGTHCAECGVLVGPAFEYRVTPTLVYCCVEHAVADQENVPF